MASILQSNEEQEQLIPSNLMFNRRVVRGNTYSAQILPGDMPMISKTLRSASQQHPCNLLHKQSAHANKLLLFTSHSWVLALQQEDAQVETVCASSKDA